MNFTYRLKLSIAMCAIVASCGWQENFSSSKINATATGTVDLNGDPFADYNKSMGKLYAQSASETMARREKSETDIGLFNGITILREFEKPTPNLKRLEQTLDWNPQVFDSIMKNSHGDFSDDEKLLDDALDELPLGIAESVNPVYAIAKPGLKLGFMLSELNTPPSAFYSHENRQRMSQQTLEQFNRETFDQEALLTRLGELYHKNPASQDAIKKYVGTRLGINPDDFEAMTSRGLATDDDLKEFAKNGASWDKKEQDQFLSRIGEKIREENTLLQKNVIAEMKRQIENLKNPPKTEKQIKYENAKEVVEGFEIGMHGVKILGQLFEPKVAQAIDQVGFPAIKITHKIVDMALGNLALRAGTMDILGLVSGVLGALLSGPSPEQIIIDMIKDLQEQVAAFREAMETRLSRIDDKLNILMINMDQHFLEVKKALEENRKDFRVLKVQIAALSRETRALSYSQTRFMQEGFLQDVNSAINSCVEYRNNYKNTDSTEYKAVVKNCINTMWDCATHRAGQSLNSGLQNNIIDFKNPNTYSDLANRLTATSKFDAYGQINFFLGAYAALESKDFAADATEVVNPRLWATCVAVYNRVAIENFSIFREFIKENSTDKNSYHQIQSMMAAGKSADKAMKSALFFEAEGNDDIRIINDLKLEGFKNLYEGRVDALQTAITESRVAIEGERFGGLDSTAGTNQTQSFVESIANSTLIDKIVPTNIRFCDSVTPEMAQAFEADKNSFNLDILIENRKQLLAKLPPAVLVATKAGLGQMSWCVSELSWSDYVKEYKPDQQLEINKGLATGQDWETPHIQRALQWNDNQLYFKYNGNKVANVTKYKRHGVWEVHVARPSVKLQGNWLSVDSAKPNELIVTPIIETTLKSIENAHVGDANHYYVYGVYSQPNGFVKHSELGKKVQEVWKAHIEHQIAASPAVLTDKISVVDNAVTANLLGNQMTARDGVMKELKNPVSNIAIASTQLEALVKVLDIGLRFSKPQSRNQDNSADQLIYGPDGLYHESQLGLIAGTSEAALFDGTLKATLMARYAKFSDYAHTLNANVAETHPIVASAIQDLELLEAMLNAPTPKNNSAK